MSTTIQIKRSSTASAVPLAGDLAVGELAVNLADKRLFAKQADGTIIELSTNPTDLDAATLRIDGVEITASATELNSLDGLTATTAELNILDGVTATATEINVLDGITSTTTELNKLDGFTGSTAELNLLDGVTATTAELNVLDGITATTTELNYTDGVTSNIQTQLNGKATSAQGALADSAVQPNDNVSFGTGSFSGEIAANGGIALGDNDKATFGTSDDLAIFHDGSNSYISDQGTGSLRITAQDFRVRNSANNASMITSIDGGSTYLYDNGAEKLATTSTGVDVTGTVTADGLTVDGAAKIINNTDYQLHLASSTGSYSKGGLFLGNASAADPYYYGTMKWVQDDVSFKISSQHGNSSGGMFLQTGSGTGTPVDRIGIKPNGDVQFYEDTGTTAKFVWDASAESLGIGTASPETELHIVASANGETTQLTIDGATSTHNAKARLGSFNDTLYLTNNYYYDSGQFGDTTSIGSASLELGHGVASIATAPAGTVTPVPRITVDSSGNVGIGVIPKTGGSTWQHVQFGGTGNLIARKDDNTVDAMFSNNYYVNSSNVDSYITTGSASRMFMNDNVISFDRASSGSADGAISWSESMRIDSSGKVGIGTGSPRGTLSLGSAATGQVVDKSIHFGYTTTDNYGWKIEHSQNPSAVAAGDLKFVRGTTAAWAESARFDNNGNLLVGTTDVDIATKSTGSGFSVYGVGQVQIAAQGDFPSAILNTHRDGEIAVFSKDGSTVGSIGTQGSELTISGGTGRSGLRMHQSTILPLTNSSLSDGTESLGQSNYRFKDLYLSGGVYLGGTGAANKLDDYEEGTWTPILTTNGAAPTGVTYSFRSGSYTKIGNVVYFRFGLYLSGITSTGSGEVRVSGLPFSGVDVGAYQESSFAIKGGNFVTSSVVTNGLFGFVVSGNPLIQFRVMTNADTVLSNSEIQANTFIGATGFYHTDA